MARAAQIQNLTSYRLTSGTGTCTKENEHIVVALCTMYILVCAVRACVRELWLDMCCARITWTRGV